MTTAADREAAKAAYLKRYFRETERKYGTTEAEWRAIFKAQGGACFICRRPFKMDKIGRGSKMPAVDHNHTTGEVRGLLCGGSFDPKTCNRLIGFFSIHVFRRAVEYLETPPARAVLAEMRGDRS